MNNLWKTLWINVEKLWNSSKPVDKLKTKIHFPHNSAQKDRSINRLFTDFSTVSTTIIMSVIIL